MKRNCKIFTGDTKTWQTFDRKGINYVIIFLASKYFGVFTDGRRLWKF